MTKRRREYYAAGRRKIMGVEPNADFTLTLSFDNGERRGLGREADVGARYSVRAVYEA